jgi:hypothetical protein
MNYLETMKKIITIIIPVFFFYLCIEDGHAQNVSKTCTKRNRLFFYPTAMGQPVKVRRAMLLYPNPASQHVEVALSGKPGAEKQGDFNIEVLDLQGKSVIRRPWQGEKLDITSLAAGMYVVTLRNGKQTFTQKLAVVRD